jgi:hypothetical protein
LVKKAALPKWINSDLSSFSPLPGHIKRRGQEGAKNAKERIKRFCTVNEFKMKWMIYILGTISKKTHMMNVLSPW